MPTPKVKYILSQTEIPVGQNYVLVMFGEKYEQTRHPRGLTITVARQESKTAKGLASRRASPRFLLANNPRYLRAGVCSLKLRSFRIGGH
jgi:hypothetical protein